MVPFFLLLMGAVLVWLFVREGRSQAPRDLTVVLRVRDAADAMESLLCATQRAGIGHVLVVDEGSTDLTPAIAAAWARRHPGVVLRTDLNVGDLAAAAIVLDARSPDRASQAERVLTWLGGGSMRQPPAAI